MVQAGIFYFDTVFGCCDSFAAGIQQGSNADVFHTCVQEFGEGGVRMESVFDRQSETVTLKTREINRVVLFRRGFEFGFTLLKVLEVFVRERVIHGVVRF